MGQRLTGLCGSSEAGRGVSRKDCWWGDGGNGLVLVYDNNGGACTWKRTTHGVMEQGLALVAPS